MTKTLKWKVMTKENHASITVEDDLEIKKISISSMQKLYARSSKLQESVGNIIADRDILKHVGLVIDASEENFAAICITHYLVIDVSRLVVTNFIVNSVKEVSATDAPLKMHISTTSMKMIKSPIVKISTNNRGLVHLGTASCTLLGDSVLGGSSWADFFSSCAGD